MMVFDHSMSSEPLSFPESRTQIRNDLPYRIDRGAFPGSHCPLAHDADPSVHWRGDEYRAAALVRCLNSVVPVCGSLRPKQQRISYGLEIGAPNCDPSHFVAKWFGRRRFPLEERRKKKADVSDHRFLAVGNRWITMQSRQRQPNSVISPEFSTPAWRRFAYQPFQQTPLYPAANLDCWFRISGGGDLHSSLWNHSAFGIEVILWNVNPAKRPAHCLAFGLKRNTYIPGYCAFKFGLRKCNVVRRIALSEVIPQAPKHNILRTEP